ncbi:NUDIX hydrolase [Elusimicrobiota bacterium]
MRKKCSTCDRISYRNPVPAVACLLKDDKDAVLLVKRAVEPAKGEWSLPSGFIEIDETPQEAALRELREETGLKGQILKMKGVYINENQIYGSVLTIGYVMANNGGILKPGSDVSQVRFQQLRDLDQIAFESHRKMLTDELFLI